MRKGPSKGPKTLLRKSFTRKNAKNLPKTTKTTKKKGKRGSESEEEGSTSGGEGEEMERGKGEEAVIPVSKWKNCLFVEEASSTIVPTTSLSPSTPSPDLSRPPSLRVGGLTVHSAGRLDDIFSDKSPQVIDWQVVPFDYKASRLYWSYKNPGKRCVYLLVTGEREGRLVFTVLASDCSQPLQCEGFIFFPYIHF